jgi:hypothetical protein
MSRSKPMAFTRLVHKTNAYEGHIRPKFLKEHEWNSVLGSMSICDVQTDFCSIRVQPNLYKTYSSNRILSVLPCNFFPLWLYSPIMGLGRLHETSRFISVTRSRTVGRTPWTGDQLVARPVLTAPGGCDEGDVGGMNFFLAGKNRSTRRKPAPTPLCPPQIPLSRPRWEPGPPPCRVNTLHINKRYPV